MIEKNTDANLMGQTELADFIQDRSGGNLPPEGYDAEGRLLNEDYPPTGEGTTYSPAVEPSTLQDIGPADVGAAMRRPPEHAPQTPADAASISTPPSPLSTLNPPPADAARLNAIAGEIHAITEHARVVLASAAIDIGKRLIEAKGLVPEGRWMEWLEKNVDYSDRQAQVMMQLAEQFGRGELPEAFRGLGISHMTALLAAPADDREDMARRAQDEGLSVRQLKEEIQKLKARKNDVEQLAFDIQQDLDAARAAIEKEREAARLAQAKASAAEASADELRRLHSDAEDRAAASAQRASDAVSRANQTVKDLAEARAKIARLEAAAAPEPEIRTVVTVPESVTQELDDLRRQLAEAQAALQKPSPLGEGGPRSGSDEVVPQGPTASDRFRTFYFNQMKPTFTTALSLLREVAQEDANAADQFATALTKGCEQLMNQLGTKEV